MAENKPQNPNHRPENPPSNSSHHHHHKYPNPPDPANPDPATLREQWNYAKRQYSRWYSSAWGTAILAGLSFYALGWIIKGSNPLPSLSSNNHNNNNNNNNTNNNINSDTPPRDAHETSES